MVKQKSQGLMDSRGGNTMIIIQRQDKLLAQAIEIVDNEGQDDRQGRGLGRLEQSQGVRVQTRADRFQRGNKVSQEAVGIIIVLIKGKPSELGRREILPRSSAACACFLTPLLLCSPLEPFAQ